MGLSEQISEARRFIERKERELAQLTEREPSPDRTKVITTLTLVLDEARADLRLLEKQMQHRELAQARRRQYAGIEIGRDDLMLMIEASYGKYSQDDFARDPDAARLLKALHHVSRIPDVTRFRIVPIAPKKERKQ